MGNAHVYVQIYYRHMYTCGYIFNAPEAGSAYMYTCKDITGICIRAKIYILWAMHMCTCNILQAHVHVRIYIFNAPEADSAYMYTCKDIYYGLSFTT